jgi:hypothetical protein
VIKVYLGEWRNDKMDGQGVLIDFESGTRYDGEFKDGQKEGKGKLIWQVDKGPRQEYNGEFKEDKMHGKGTLTFENGSTYDV